MKKLLGALLGLMSATLASAAAANLSPINVTTSRAQFEGGDSITIQEVLATSANFAVGDTFVVRGTYNLQSRDAAIMSISLTTTEPIPVPAQNLARKQIAAGTASFEMEYTIQFAGSVYIAFTPVSGGSSFGRIYLSGGSGPAPTNPGGLTSVPFVTSRAQYAAGDSLTLQEVLCTSPRMEPGDTVIVRGRYTLQSRERAVLLASLSAFAPGAAEPVSPTARKEIAAGSDAFELTYEIRQPGALHVSFYPAGSGSSFGGIYFAPPGSAGTPTTVTVNNPAANTGTLGNLSVRSLVGTGDAALVAGLAVTDRERYVLIRGVGPSLAAFGVSGVLRRPVLNVYASSGEVIATAGSWSAAFTGDQRTGIEMLSRSVGAFPLTSGSDDAVLHLRLLPGTYTISVSAADGQSGVGLLEVYASSTYTLPAAP